MKTLKIALTICLFGIVSMAACASDIEVEGISYNVVSATDKTVEVTSSNDFSYKGKIVIPESIMFEGTEYSVVKIDESAFASCMCLTEVFVPRTIKEISYHSFDDCSNLKSINVDSKNHNFASIDGVLYNKQVTALVACPGSIKTVNLPSSVKMISGYTLFGSLKGFTLQRR